MVWLNYNRWTGTGFGILYCILYITNFRKIYLSRQKKKQPFMYLKNIKICSFIDWVHPEYFIFRPNRNHPYLYKVWFICCMNNKMHLIVKTLQFERCILVTINNWLEFLYNMSYIHVYPLHITWPSRKHVYITLTNLNPLLDSKTGVYRGIHYFSYFCSKT